MSPKKTVQFRSSPSVRSYDSNDKSVAQILSELKSVEEAVIDFLKRPVYKILIHWGKDFRGTDQLSARQHAAYMNQFAKAMIGDDVLVRDAVYAYLIQNLAAPASELIHKAIEQPRDSINRVASLFILHAGLNTFFKFNQCKNKCYEVIRYHPTEWRVDALPLGKSHGELLDACMDSHGRIQDAIGIDDIRAFDKLLHIASKGKCSLIAHPSQAGGASPRPYDFRVLPTATIMSGGASARPYDFRVLPTAMGGGAKRTSKQK